MAIAHSSLLGRNDWSIIAKATVVHTATYFVMGVFAFYTFNYAAAFSHGPEAAYMSPTTDVWVAAGPLFQPLRGALFGVVFYLLRDALFSTTRGWVLIWIMLAGLGILNTFAPAPGSIEGFIYLSTPASSQIGLGSIEIYGQSLMLALGTFYWVRRPNRWLAWGLSVVAALAIAASLAGIFIAPLAKSAG